MTKTRKAAVAAVAVPDCLVVVFIRVHKQSCGLFVRVGVLGDL